MKCPQCVSENPEQAHYCSSCGAALNRSCASCGAAAAADARFCGSCGAVLELLERPGATPGERRPATILFADVVGFSTLAERLDPEELRARMTDTFERITAAIRDEEGWVEKFIGDAVLAVFGMPSAHEDDAQRAVRAGLAVQRLLEGGDLAIRIGVNTGLVVTGPVGDGSAVGVMGDAVNVAARLQQIADPGTILIAASTHKLVKHVFDTRPAGTRTVKGRSEQVGAYEVLGQREKPDRLRALAPLVGRDNELTVLAALWQTVRSGRPQLVSLIGEPGVGKTRLVHEFAEIVRDEATILRANCPQRQASPYAPIVAMIEDAVGPGLDLDVLIATAERLHVDREAAVLVGGLLGFAPMDATGPDEESRRRCFGALTELLAGFARDRPTLAVLEDVHWADPSTWDVASTLMRRLPAAPLAFLVTCRPAFVGLESVRTQAGHTVIRLDALPAGDAQELARALAEGAIPEEVARAVADRAEGNPFFVEEIVRSLVEEGVLVRSERRWMAAQPVEAVGIPETVQGVILARIDRLPESARRTLQRASVIGREFRPELLRILSEGAAVEQDLEELERADLLSAGAGIDRTFEFKHALTQEVAYATLLLRQRQLLHRLLAEDLERDPRPDAALLAYHWLQAGDLERAGRHARAAADAAVAVFAIGDASRQLTIALECVGEDRTRDRAHLLLRRAELASELLTLQSHDPMADLDEAASIYTELGDVRMRARCVGRMGRLAYFRDGDYETALRRFDEGRRLLADDGDSEELLRLLADSALVDLVQARPETGVPASELGIEVSERLGARDQLAPFFGTLGVFRAQLGDFDSARELLQRSLELARENDQRDEVARVYVNLCWLYQNVAGDVDRAIEIGREGVEIAVALRLEGRLLPLTLNLAQALAGKGAFAEALDMAKKLAAENAELPNWGSSFVLMMLGTCALNLGDLAGAREHGVRAVAAGSRTQESQHMIPARLIVGWCAAESGDRAGVAIELEEIARFYERNPSDRFTLSEELLGCVQLAFSAGDRDRGRRFAAWLAEARGDRTEPWSRVAVGTARAEVAAADDRVEEARRQFAEADRAWPEVGRPWLHARTLRRWAETVAEPGERRALLRRALELVRETTARLEESKIEAALADADR